MENDSRLLIAGIGLILGLSASCSRRAENKVPSSPSSVARSSTSDPDFDKKWAALSHAGVDVAYIENDRGEGLMGNLRRPSRARAVPPAALADPTADQPGDFLPEQPAGEEIQRIIRGNLMAVRGCYMSIARTGQVRSGKAIVSFAIGADGRPASVKVDAPTFHDTPLPGCVTAQIARWSFPRSQKGGGSVSYPFVFVGG
jgi:hypothetical protein